MDSLMHGGQNNFEILLENLPAVFFKLRKQQARKAKPVPLEQELLEEIHRMERESHSFDSVMGSFQSIPINFLFSIDNKRRDFISDTKDNVEADIKKFDASGERIKSTILKMVSRFLY